MPAPGDGKASRPDAGAVAERFEALAQQLRRQTSDTQISSALEALAAACEAAAGAAREAELKALLPNLRTAVQTWREVWPRLGRQAEFRAAVIREAELWARRLSAAGGKAQQP